MGKTAVEKALQAIADGYPYCIQTPDILSGWLSGYIAVNNPDFQEDDGSDPFLIIEYING
jgi:hypothetical protein